MENATTTPLTADHIRRMIQPTGSETLSAVLADQQQSWVWRCLLYCLREQRRDLKRYRSDLGKVENRGSPAYWVDWMSYGNIGKDSSPLDVHSVILHGDKMPTRRLSGKHLDNAVRFLCEDGVAEAILKFVQRPTIEVR